MNTNLASEQIRVSEETLSKEQRKSLVKQMLGYLIAIVCLIWVFHDIHAERLFRQVAEINWGWVGLAVLFDVLSYFSQGMRWELLLRPVGQTSPWRTTQAIYVGLFTNEILPLRVGELVRAYLVSRWLPTPLISVIPSMAVERFFDAIWLAIGIGVTALFVHLPKDLLDAADILGVFVLSVTALFAYLVFRKKKKTVAHPKEHASLWKPLRVLISLIDRLASGIQKIGTSRHVYLALLVSSLIIVGQILSFWLVMLGYGLPLSLWTGAAVLLIVHLGTALPNAPSNLGTYQFFCVLGLTLFGIDKTTATGFSVVVFIILTLPLWAIGLFAINRTGMKLKEIRKEINKLMARQKVHADV